MQFRLHLLSVLLVIQTINSTTINESLIDQNRQDVATRSSNSQQMDSGNDQQIKINQSNRSIYHSNDEVQNVNTNIDASKPTRQLDKPASNLSSGKTFNKIDFRKRKVKSVVIQQTVDWMCPIMTENSQYLECGCDLPHTLRCSGDIHGLEQIADGLRHSNYSVSLLDCTLKNVTFLSDARIFENVSLHGLVISSGEIKRVHRLAFLGMKTALQALGLPNNALTDVPYQSLSSLTSLDRLDLSNNRIKYLGAADFLMLQNLSFLELSDNHISGISMRAFLTLKRLQILKLNGNRLEANGNALQAIGQCANLKELDLSSNLLRGSLTNDLLPPLKSLESLNLDTNLLTRIHSSALESFSYLKTLSMSHNQIDVLQDHAFSGLTSLQILDLSYNGIVAVSGASLKHLTRLLFLNLTHNFLRALSSDLVAPLPSLQELQLDGNDISIVAKNAFETATDLERLSLQDNPLSCDCSLKPFAEWLSMSNISQKDQLSAVCATPPHLEGATLQQIPLGSLNCDGNVNKINNANVLQQLEIRSKQTNLTYDTKFSDEIILKKIHLSMDYGLILTWSVSLRNHEFSCDAIIVYKESNSNETLVDSPTVHCEHYRIENENIVSVILYDTGRFVIGENYRFCLVLIQRDDDDQELVVGCSNITKLKQIENNLAADDQPKKHINIARIENTQNKVPEESREQQIVSDISSFDKISDSVQDEFQYDNDLHVYSTEKGITKTTTINIEVEDEHETTTIAPNAMRKSSEKLYAPRLIDTIDESFLPAIGIAVLITSLFGLIWFGTKLSNNRRSNPATVCYAASDQHSVDIENRNRYLKLQATTTL